MDPLGTFLDALVAMAGSREPLSYVNQGKIHPADRGGPTWGEVAGLVAVARAVHAEREYHRLGAPEGATGARVHDEAVTSALAALRALAERREA